MLPTPSGRPSPARPPARRLPASAPRLAQTPSDSSRRPSLPATSSRCGSSSSTPGLSRPAGPWPPGGAGPEVILNAQKQWADQLEAMAKTFAEVMGTETFANMIGRYMEQSLVAQQRAANASEPPDGLPCSSPSTCRSRSQIDRLFERVIGLEDRIDDLEDENRKLRTQVEALRPPASPPHPPPAPPPHPSLPQPRKTATPPSPSHNTTKGRIILRPFPVSSPARVSRGRNRYCRDCSSLSCSRNRAFSSSASRRAAASSWGVRSHSPLTGSRKRSSGPGRT